MSMRDRFKAIIARQSDKQLMETLTQQGKKVLSDWRNWGENPHRYMAEEAHKRGLIA